MRRLEGLRQLFSDLNLNGATPVRVQPLLGEWEPRRVPTTKQKKRARITVSVAFVVSVVALFYLGNFFYKTLMGIS